MAEKQIKPYTPADLPPPTAHASGLKELKPRRHWWRWIVAGIVLVIVVAGSLSYLWYRQALRPLDDSNHQKIRVQIIAGATADKIGNLLEKKQIIRSSKAFQIYTRLNGNRNHLQAGIYALAPSQSVASITTQLVEGKTSVLNATIYPGSTLKDIQKALQKQGFKTQDIQRALNEDNYQSPLLADKPPGANLEGYLFPETYQLSAGDSPHTLFQRSIDELYANLQQHNLIQAFKAQNLTIYQAITLASIVQQEVGSAKEQKQVAQVFLTRLKQGLSLGSDVTFIYAAKQLGVTPRPDLASPYNTRIHKGLPPGPISNMTLTALEAVAHPASGDYLFFVAGDDGTIHYAHTVEEHEKNIKNYCHHLCK